MNFIESEHLIKQILQNDALIAELKKIGEEKDLLLAEKNKQIDSLMVNFYKKILDDINSEVE